MNKVDKIKVVVSVFLVIVYLIPLLIPRSAPCDCPTDFVDFFYGIVTTLGIGGYFIVDSYKLQKQHEDYLFSAGVFFVLLGLIFFFNAVSDIVFKTYWYAVFNILITIICFVLLTTRRFFTPR